MRCIELGVKVSFILMFVRMKVGIRLLYVDVGLVVSVIYVSFVVCSVSLVDSRVCMFICGVSRLVMGVMIMGVVVYGSVWMLVFRGE